MGARGNSGVITSQIFRGMAEGMAGKTRFNGLDLAHSLSEGARTAYGAVAKPVEGTILTVIRESAAAAVTAAERDADIEKVMAATVDAAERSVASTPTLLDVLREAGVVDSGGQGIYRLFEGALLHLAGRAPMAASREGELAGPGKASAVVAHADDGFGYETMFLLHPNGSGALDLDAIRDRLDEMGDSVLVAGDARAVKVHVHNDRPDLVIGFGLSVGALSRISVENLDHQARDVRESKAAEFTGLSDADTATASTTDNKPPNPSGPPAIAVVAVVSGEGLAAIFRDFGVAAVVDGGQSDNPSTGELLDVIASVDAREIIILPNNRNVLMAARQVASMTDRTVVVVPTRNAAEGFAALLAMDPTLDGSANAVEMTEAGHGIQTFVVTEAVRDASIGGRKVKHGQTIALDPDEGLIAVDGDREKCVLKAVAGLKPGYELLSLFYGDGATLTETERLARRIGTVTPGIEVEVRHGGQAFYRYLIAAE
jgi:DAK2 domain fusion protein YloV